MISNAPRRFICQFVAKRLYQYPRTSQDQVTKKVPIGEVSADEIVKQSLNGAAMPDSLQRATEKSF
jgi:hypothetical protein